MVDNQLNSSNNRINKTMFILDYKHDCKRYYCHFCLKANYEVNVDLIKSKKDWICPYCEVRPLTLLRYYFI